MSLPSFRGRMARGQQLKTLVAGLVLAQLVAVPAAAEFEADLARIDAEISSGRHFGHALLSCQARRWSAIRLYESGQLPRAERALKYCFTALGIPEEATTAVVIADVPTEEELAERAAREIERALALQPNVENGLRIYRECAGCHTREGWGLPGGTVPQIAGQHRAVIVKQLADIRVGNRDVGVMIAYASAEALGGAQAIADVAGYIESLEIGIGNSKGKGDDLELGERLYAANCASCHGPNGEGDAAEAVPRIHAQQYNYLVRQFEWIRDGRRRNANPEMQAQIASFGDREVAAVLDYVSRLVPPEDLQAPPGWKNPDFAE